MAVRLISPGYLRTLRIALRLLALGRALASLFFGVSVADPILFGAAALLLAAVALLASAGPAWRVARVSPSEALQE